MKPFVTHTSIVRKIWGQGDTILFIFAGGAAEFALNRAVDWLYYTGKLPEDPVGRLFSTVTYARRIVFASREEALQTIQQMAMIHQGLETKRGYTIPDWAYRDVLYMLIFYSIASYELLERRMTQAEKEEVYDVFKRVGEGMGLKSLPANYINWLPERQSHLEKDLERSAYTVDLFNQYRRQLGPFRFRMLLQAQKLVIPAQVRELLHFHKVSCLAPAVPVYRVLRKLQLHHGVMKILLPNTYWPQVRELNIRDNSSLVGHTSKETEKHP